ncbi:EscR/YscR/HrcR family type III secretion system export apparatus protein [Bradyrhizobium sp. Y36]|uniref:type III secretion system export apparatus subunit SctR n=1 Tax=Bradyrhizobium sp. Y36 TaxID=2035447 RepID=UPI000BEA3465|nr:type III secretion system export apparatus subunit SctR [Bradyrhizobium sp. Y36]PDT90826.1 EscR/YscR/HrcR family type III secretion system export apparatus protein [Bradyrhizobium sp. Y36]
MTDPFNLILILGIAALLPFIAVVTTSFIKLSVVLSLVRNALGVQQVPPNIALNALAMILSAYIMAPVVMETYDLVSAAKPNYGTADGLKTAFEAGRGPLERFLGKHASSREKAFFLESARELWPKNISDGLTADNIVIVLPAFTVSQLREAFEVGFLLYLPFLAIDLIVTNILLALGMMMVSPLTISLPFKLFLFITVDGWSRLILGLVKTYAH